MSDSPGSIHIIRADHLQRKPWKNGGGSTAEIAVAPAGAGLDDFDWRISMADVEADGPFSLYPGIARTLVLLHGDGIDLAIDGESYRVDRGARTIHFPGDLPTVGTLIGGPTRDFNIMTRRSRFAHRVERIGPGELVVESETILLAETSACTLSTDTDQYRLGLFDILHVKPPCRLVLDATVLEVRLLSAFAVTTE